ncbi:hypothetical protein F511_02479 [Dorcoceras hygrometricum]|nr:hypothetical protein F511_02479 [Dorcoceras hygrometricum]
MNLMIHIFSISDGGGFSQAEVASPDQGDANTHVDNIDTEPDTSSDESDEEPADAEHEDIMHEGTSSRPVRGETSQR